MKRFGITAVVLVLALVTPVLTLAKTNAAQAEQQGRELHFWVITPEDINRLCRVAIEQGEVPSPEGHLYLEFKSAGFRQYVTLSLARGLFGSLAAIERVDFIQEQWQVNRLEQDEIDQWVISTNGYGATHYVWHKLLLEDKAALLKEEFLPVDEGGTKAIVAEIVARFLPSRIGTYRTAGRRRRPLLVTSVVSHFRLVRTVRALCGFVAIARYR